MAIVTRSRPVLVIVDVVAWGAVHSVTGYLVHRCPVEWFATDTWLTRHRRWEGDGQVYERAGIRRWKDRLPEAGALFAGGVSKRTIPTTSDGGLARLVVETRRAEWGHWLAAGCAPLFALWNPLPIAVAMLAYGAAVNSPFIAIQRYNRLRASRISSRRADRSRSSRDTTGTSMP